MIDSDTTGAVDGTRPVLDTTIAPLGERALRSVLAYATAVGDEAETAYLELKGPLDMASKATTAKIAKFVLGAANRDVRTAARHFQGHALLIIGVQDHQAVGVPRGTEPHDIENKLHPYVGTQVPPFELGRVGVGQEREVLFIIAPPPHDGHPIFPCLRNYQGDDRNDNLEDGAIYVRGTSNTRRATSGEVLSLLERAKGQAKPPIDLEVELQGHIHRVDGVDELMEGLHSWLENEFQMESKLQTETPSSTDPLAMIRSRLAFPPGVRPLSPSDREAALRSWHRKRSQHAADGRAYILGTALTGAGVQVTSRGRFIAQPRLTLALHDCEVLPCLDPADADIDLAYQPVLGRNESLWDQRGTIRDAGVPVVWENSGDDVQVTLTPDSLRPDTPWATTCDDYLVLSRGTDEAQILISWTLTEADSHHVTSGSLTLAAPATQDAGTLFEAAFFPTG